MDGVHPGASATKRLVVVAGSGRSGTSTIAGVLKYLGLHIPTPEVAANVTNPRGFFEPRWVVSFQTKLLNQARVRLTDARPAAFDLTAEVVEESDVRDSVKKWLTPQFETASEIVLKDPRNAWFLPMWREAAAAQDADPGFVVMLRHPAEVVGSKSKYYEKAGRLSARALQTTRVAAWLNVNLFGEAATRGASRTFIRYNDLLSDWRTAVGKAAEDLQLSLRDGFPEEGVAEVDDFIDPDLRRVQTTWDEIDAPAALVDMCEQGWQLMCRLADADGGRNPGVEAELDELRARYTQYYAEAEAVATSTADAPSNADRARTRAAAGGSPAAGPARPRPVKKQAPPPRPPQRWTLPWLVRGVRNRALRVWRRRKG